MACRWSGFAWGGGVLSSCAASVSSAVSTRARRLGRVSSARLNSQRAQPDAELGLGLEILGAGSDPATMPAPAWRRAVASGYLGTAKGQRPLPVAARVDPAHEAREEAALEGLEAADQRAAAA